MTVNKMSTLQVIIIISIHYAYVIAQSNLLGPQLSSFSIFDRTKWPVAPPNFDMAYRSQYGDLEKVMVITLLLTIRTNRICNKRLGSKKKSAVIHN